MADWFYFVWVVVGMASATVLTRSAFLLLPQRWQLSSRVLIALRYAPMAAIAAIITPDLITWRPMQSEFALNALFSPKLLAALMAAIVHWRFANMLLSMAVGMFAFWALRYAATMGLMG
jgi:branched-subunit amino acid transport protein